MKYIKGIVGVGLVFVGLLAGNYPMLSDGAWVIVGIGLFLAMVGFQE